MIVSDEPLLPRVEWEPDAKVESYMNASDAVVALCTPDDTLADGTVQTRPNIIDEIRMARERPNLRDRVLVAKARLCVCRAISTRRTNGSTLRISAR